MGLFYSGDNTTNYTGLGDDQYAGITANQLTLGDGIGNVKSVVDRTKNAVNTINTNTANTANTVDTINTNTAGLSDQILGLEGGFTTLGDNMRTYNTGMNTRFDTVDAANTANAANLGTANTGITGLQSSQDAGFAGTDARFNTVDADNLGIQTDVDQGFNAVDTGQTNLSNQMTTGFDTTQGDIGSGFDQARIDNDAGFAGIGATQTANEALRAAGQTAIQGDINTMSGTADTYADAIIAKQGTMEGVQDRFVSSFDDYVGKYTEDTTLAGQARVDAALAADTYDKNIRADMGRIANTQSAGQDALGNQITSAESTIGQNLNSGFSDATALTNAGFSDAASNVNTGFAAASAQDRATVDATRVEDLKKATNLAAVASGMETLDINTRQEFHQLSNAFDDEGALIQNSIDANGNTLQRSIDDKGNMIIDKFNVNGQAMGQKMFNIDLSIAALKEIPSQGSNAAMGNLTPALAASQLNSGFMAGGGGSYATTG